MELAIVEYLLALRTDGTGDSILQRAKELSQRAITDGAPQLSYDIPRNLREALSRVVGPWPVTLCCLLEMK